MSAERIRVELGARSYDVLIGPGLIASSRRADRSRPARAARRDRHRRERRRSASARACAHRCSGPASARRRSSCPPAKTRRASSQLQIVVEAILETRLERGDAVLALGGGVIGDLAGFAAAIARRGMQLRPGSRPRCWRRSIPASAARPASIRRFGKNLVGAFHQPALVLADTDALDTLPAREFAAGYAEMAKYGLIGDAGVLRVARERTRGGLSRRRGAHPRHRRERARSRRARSPRTSARRASAPSSISAIRSGMRWRPPAASTRRGSCTARRSRSAWCWRTISRSQRASRRAADAERVRAHLKGAGLPVRIARHPRPAALGRRADAAHRAGQEGEARTPDLHPDARHRPRLHCRRRASRERGRLPGRADRDLIRAEIRRHSLTGSEHI